MRSDPAKVLCVVGIILRVGGNKMRWDKSGENIGE